MIPLAQVAEIRRLFFAEHWRVGTLATQLGLHPDTVRRALATERFVRPAILRASHLDPYRPFLQETLQRYPRLRAPRLFEMLRQWGYPGSVVQLRRVVRMLRPVPAAEAYLRLTLLVGEQGQADWGSFGTVTIGHATRRLSAFVLVLSWSRALHAAFTLDPRPWRASSADTSRRSRRFRVFPGLCCTITCAVPSWGAAGRRDPAPPPPPGGVRPFPRRPPALRGGGGTTRRGAWSGRSTPSARRSSRPGPSRMWMPPPVRQVPAPARSPPGAPRRLLRGG